MSGVSDTKVLIVFYENNTSQSKGWIFNSDSTFHICSHKEMSNSLVAKEEEIVKMVDGSACKVIKITCRNGRCVLLEVVMYVPEARYNFISIKVLDKEGCRIKVQQDVITISQGDKVILYGEKCGGYIS